jgi:hypothetical protein
LRLPYRILLNEQKFVVIHAHVTFKGTTYFCWPTLMALEPVGKEAQIPHGRRKVKGLPKKKTLAMENRQG